MPYLVAGGAAAFKDDTAKIVKVLSVEVKVSGSNLVPIIGALQHHEAVSAMGVLERQKALCSLLSKCNKWYITKGTKLAAVNAAGPVPTVLKRARCVRALMLEVMAALNASDSTLNTAIQSYERNKSLGSRPAAEQLSMGYANERGAYLLFNKSKSLSGSLIDDLLHKKKDRNLNTLPVKAEAKFDKQYRSKHKELEELSLSDWKKIDDIAQDVNGHQLEVRYMRKFERLKVMLESDGAGGLRYVVGQRSANCGASSWPYAMDEWGNIYTADHDVVANKGGYAMFNHSTFTAGDKVVCAGMLQIDAAGKLTAIDTNSGHYKPSRAQLQAVVGILQTEYHVDMSGTFIETYEKHPDPTIGVPKVSQWTPGNCARFLAGGAPG
jgi:hypothetical protein